MLKKLWIAVPAAVAAAAVAIGAPALAAPGSRASTALPVTGYAEDGTATSVVDASAAALATVGVDGVNITSTGTSVPAPGSGDLKLLNEARNKHLRAEFLVGNYSTAIGDFDSTAAHDLLSSKTNTSRVVASLVSAVTKQGWDGVTVDLEAINGQDRAGLVSFVTALKKAMPQGKTVSLDVTAFTSAQEYLDNGYDLAALGAVLDRVALMAYDEHGPTWNGVGPIGGLPWQRQCLDVLLTQVPAAKVDLGVAGYGYTWPTQGTGVQVSDSQARAMVKADGSTATWNATQGEWTATLHDGTVMWWSDATSWPLRVSLAQSYKLHGLALWSLGLSDPLSAPSSSR